MVRKITQYLHKLKRRVLPSLFDSRRHEYLGRLKPTQAHTTVFNFNQKTCKMLVLALNSMFF